MHVCCSGRGRGLEVVNPILIGFTLTVVPARKRPRRRVELFRHLAVAALLAVIVLLGDLQRDFHAAALFMR